MPNLHPEVLALIKAGPQRNYHDRECADCGGFGFTEETPQEFARRCVEFAVEKEREAMRDAFIDALIETDATWSVAEARNVACDAIRRRGKP